MESDHPLQNKNKQKIKTRCDAFHSKNSDIFETETNSTKIWKLINSDRPTIQPKIPRNPMQCKIPIRNCTLKCHVVLVSEKLYPSTNKHNTKTRWDTGIILKALANEDTLLRTHCCRHKCFPVCPPAQYLLRTQILCLGHKKCFWFCSETFCVRNKCFPVCAAQETSWTTMCPQQCLLAYQGLKETNKHKTKTGRDTDAILRRQTNTKQRQGETLT